MATGMAPFNPFPFEDVEPTDCKKKFVGFHCVVGGRINFWNLDLSAKKRNLK